MSRSTRLLFLLLGLFPHPAKAFRLEWSTGSTSLSFNSATRCTLVLQADAAETQLPSEWRLLWVADTLAIEFVPEEVPAGCPSDTALVLSVVGPTTKADSIANLVTERFCSAGGTPASIARYVFDIAASGRGKFKVVALAPDDPDSVSVIRSNEVICNGGLAGSYPPAEVVR